ncbi:MAG: hypothetical protein ACYSU5_16360 [Planctomycetota bacterium]|jgi:hypothetical protein
MCKNIILLICFVLVLMISAPVFGDDILAPGDFIIAIDTDGGSASPGAEPVTEAIDQIYGGANEKYLNNGGANSGFIVTPAYGPSIIDSFTIWTANDAEPRDPATWQLYGTNAAIVSAMHSTGTAESWTLIDSGSISLPAGRNATDNGPGGNNATVLVTSTETYASYKMLFPTLKGAGEYMQIAEVQFYGVSYSPSARAPDPAHLAVDVPVDTNLGWIRGDGANSDEVYFGTDPCALPKVADIMALPIFPPLYDPPVDLAASTTYYWQIVEVNGIDRYESAIWEFTTVRGEAQCEYPFDGAIIVGDMAGANIWTKLIFIPGATAASHVGYFSEDYSKVASRDPTVWLGPPPYAGTPGWEYTLFAGNPSVPPANQTLVRGTRYYWTVDCP